MARASRSNKTQPAFDPSELSDLIFSPAVGRGVGSHLVEIREPAPIPLPNSDVSIPTTVDRFDLPSIDNLHVSSEVRSDTLVFSSSEPSSQIVDIHQLESTVTSLERDMSTVDMQVVPTVDKLVLDSPLAEVELSTVPMIEWPTVDSVNPPTVDTFSLDTVDMPPKFGLTAELEPDLDPKNLSQDSRATEPATVVSMNLSTVDRSLSFVTQTKEVKIWITEQGELVPGGRVKKIGPAQDVLNSAEESVYDTLWAAKIIGAGDDETSRLVQAGYHYLAKKTRLSKKTIQRIIDKLIHKGFIVIEQQADIYARTSTIYRVFNYSAVKERQRRKNRFYAAKIGPGFTYVHEYAPGHLSTVGMSQPSTVAAKLMSTQDKLTPETVVPRDLSTVVRQTTYIDRVILDKTTSSVLYKALNEYGQADDDAVKRLLQKCRQIAPDCKEEEIVHFIHQKGSLIRGKGSEIYSPIGFLVTAVPKCFSGESFRLYREEQRRHCEAEAAEELQRRKELDEWRREQEQRLDDPEVADEDKRLIRECLGIQ